MITKSRSFVLSTSSSVETTKWIDAINNIVASNIKISVNDTLIPTMLIDNNTSMTSGNKLSLGSEEEDDGDSDDEEDSNVIVWRQKREGEQQAHGNSRNEGLVVKVFRM